MSILSMTVFNGAQGVGKKVASSSFHTVFLNLYCSKIFALGHECGTDVNQLHKLVLQLQGAAGSNCSSAIFRQFLTVDT